MPKNLEITKPRHFRSFLPERSENPSHVAFRARLVEVLDAYGAMLPSSEKALGKLWSLVHGEGSSIQECAAVIAIDPALTAHVFRVANSAVYGGEARTVSEAVFHLGFAQIRQIACNRAVHDQFSQLKLTEGWETFWLRNIFVSRMAERIASLYFKSDGSEYLASLLHDSGWLFLATFFPDEFTDLLLHRGSLPEGEEEILGLSHTDISAAICTISLLPPRVVNAVLHHSVPVLLEEECLCAPSQSDRFLGTLLHVCDRLADCAGLRVIRGREMTLEEFHSLPEVFWLNSRLGREIPFETLLAEELPKAEEIAASFL